MSVPDGIALLAEYLAAGHQVAQRLSLSLRRTSGILPLDAAAIQALSQDDKERIDAFLFRFASLAAIVQDHIGRAVLSAEEEDRASASRKDQRLMPEKLGALDPELGFGSIAVLRNRLAHTYPDDPVRQAAILNLATANATNLLAGFNGLLTYAAKFGVGSGLRPVDIPPTRTPPPA